MASTLVDRIPLQTARRPRTGDGLRALIVSSALCGVLATVFVGATAARVPLAGFFAAPGQTAAPAEQVQDDHRIGSILFVSGRKMCDELQFDNISERLVSVDSVDCEVRLARDSDDEAHRRASARTLRVFAAFRK